MVERNAVVWKYLFYAVIGFHALYQLAFGMMTLIAPKSLEAPYGFNNQAPESYLLVLIVALGQFFLTTVAVLSIYWTYKNQSSGAILGICLGFYFLLFGIAGIWTVDNRTTLYIDIARGFLTIFSGFVVLKNTKKYGIQSGN